MWVSKTNVRLRVIKVSASKHREKLSQVQLPLEAAFCTSLVLAYASTSMKRLAFG